MALGRYRKNFLEYYEMIARGGLFDEWYDWYIQNPGLTGEGQLDSANYRDHNRDTIRRRMKIDINACESATFKKDLKTIARTPVLLFRSAMGAN